MTDTTAAPEDRYEIRRREGDTWWYVFDRREGKYLGNWSYTSRAAALADALRLNCEHRAANKPAVEPDACPDCARYRAALRAHDEYMVASGYCGPDDEALHPKAAENWRRIRAVLAEADPHGGGDAV